MKEFLQTLATQRHDDHRYYHHSTVNQALHLVSALCFLCAYALMFTDPVAAALVGWLLAMTSRQVGHFFFEPKGYDAVNQATHEHKEAIKVGYNLRRKTVLIAIWAAAPLLLVLDPTLFGVFEPAASPRATIDHIGWMWLAIGIGGLLFRTVHLFFLQGVQAGLAWMTKILTDPFHDIKLYYRAPLHLLQGHWMDPSPHQPRN